MDMDPLEDKFTAFGFAVRSVKGNSIPDLIEVFDNLPFEAGKPNLILARTIKGTGISYIEDQVQWHHRVPSEEEYATAMQELDEAEKALVD